jgi:hypothetical protein
MVTFTTSDQLRGAELVDVDLRDSRFVGSDLSGAVLRGVDVQGTEIDAPWLFDGSSFLRVSGVDVTPFVDAELDHRFPAVRSDGPAIPTACGRPGRRWNVPGKPCSSGQRACRPARWTSRWPASGPSPRRSAT